MITNLFDLYAFVSGRRLRGYFLTCCVISVAAHYSAQEAPIDFSGRINYIIDPLIAVEKKHDFTVKFARVSTKLISICVTLPGKGDGIGIATVNFKTVDGPDILFNDLHFSGDWTSRGIEVNCLDDKWYLRLIDAKVGSSVYTLNKDGGRFLEAKELEDFLQDINVK
jgi:hypothetical protein